MSYSIEKIEEQIRKCKACPLHKTRLNTVPGVGSIKSPIMFVGEGPGADEDEQGVPFVGRAGQLLTKILSAVELKREDLYITNVVKCRPPENRNPKEEEMKACSNFLYSQIALINPKIIVTVGSVATKALIGDLIGKEGITKLRGKFFEWRGIRVMPILHPSYLLRNPSVEKGKPKWLTWQDMLIIREEYNKLNGRT